MLVANIDHKFIYDINLILYLLIWLIWFYFHISKLCSTAATQLNVLSRLKKYMGKKWWKLQGLGSLSKSKRKIKKTYPREYSYIFQKKKKKSYPKDFLYSRIEPNLVYYTNSHEKFLILSRKTPEAYLNKISYKMRWLLIKPRIKHFSKPRMNTGLVCLTNFLNSSVK